MSKQKRSDKILQGMLVAASGMHPFLRHCSVARHSHYSRALPSSKQAADTSPCRQWKGFRGSLVLAFTAALVSPAMLSTLLLPCPQAHHHYYMHIVRPESYSAQDHVLPRWTEVCMLISATQSALKIKRLLSSHPKTARLGVWQLVCIHAQVS